MIMNIRTIYRIMRKSHRKIIISYILNNLITKFLPEYPTQIFPQPINFFMRVHRYLRIVGRNNNLTHFENIKIIEICLPSWHVKRCSEKLVRIRMLKRVMVAWGHHKSYFAGKGRDQFEHGSVVWSLEVIGHIPCK